MPLWSPLIAVKGSVVTHGGVEAAAQAAEDAHLQREVLDARRDVPRRRKWRRGEACEYYYDVIWRCLLH